MEFHQPVLLKETIENLKIKKNGKYIDGTVGGGGHSEAILKLNGNILGIDCDPEALDYAREHLSAACPFPDKSRELDVSWLLARGNFKDIDKIAKENNFDKVDGILLDLGVSSYQLETPERGFSFNNDSILDMRMDPDLKVTAKDLINILNKDELEKLFKKFAQEKLARRLAETIVDARRLNPIKSGLELAEIILKVKPRRGKIHPATQIFQALRMAVNDELNNLNEFLPKALQLLKTGGRLAIISFHSGEDRIVKQFLRQQEEKGIIKKIFKKPISPSFAEVRNNPRSRSAKLRVAEKV
ncbi:MAG: 16S rRNA (cytosine(1402)-N(4))-methyltransferase RsmH [Candidatus Shapirobacteria bacterium]|nr:16S rRNA (cytosine(1402)-N(4))-methyltransferase RsmH [Candidatus Shapirobacteria bacterium]